MKYLTVRNLPEDVARALGHERNRRNNSLNQTVIDLLRRALGMDPEGSVNGYTNGLRRLAGDWSAEQFEEFERATAAFGRIDEDLWR